MPEQRAISELTTQPTANLSDLFEVSVVNAQSASGYSSKKMSAEVIAEGIVNTYNYPTAMPAMQSRSIIGAINALLSNFAPIYDATATYEEDDLVTYNGALYKANQDISTAEEWNSSHWTQTTVAESGGGGGGGGGASSLDDLTDVDISTPTAGQVLVYDDTNDTWINGNAGNSSEQVISMADYLALTDAEKNNGTSYYIYDAVNEGREIQPVIYSLEEREIGVWTDGKPLYEKTFLPAYVTPTHSASQTVTFAIDIHDLNVDTVVYLDGIWQRWAGDGAKLLYRFTHSESNYGEASLRVDSENNYPNGRINVSITSEGTDWQCVTIQYTKTTDIAGSGNFVPSGVPAVHYDGNEKVIGTWFGETLYEKTITGVSFRTSANAWADTGIAFSNVDQVITCIGGQTNTSMFNLGFAKVDNGTLRIWTTNNADYEFNKITIQYTKSS